MRRQEGLGHDPTSLRHTLGGAQPHLEAMRSCSEDSQSLLRPRTPPLSGRQTHYLSSNASPYNTLGWTAGICRHQRGWSRWHRSASSLARWGVGREPLTANLYRL